MRSQPGDVTSHRLVYLPACYDIGCLNVNNTFIVIFIVIAFVVIVIVVNVAVIARVFIVRWLIILTVVPNVDITTTPSISLSLVS